MTEVEQLKQRIAELEAQLEPYLERDREEAVTAVRKGRILEIIEVLFPKSNIKSTGPEQEYCHPERSWWWNGAKILDSWQLHFKPLVKEWVARENATRREADRKKKLEAAQAGLASNLAQIASLITE